jgi:ubiquinone/menaquinone biosynthesis C-methylase UbiE
MTHEEILRLIRRGIEQRGGVWADFGAGTGNFTRALRDLLGPEAILYAIDRDAQALSAHRDALTIQADFTRPIELPPLDGVLMANALHWTRFQSETLQQIRDYLRPGGRLILVEYEVRWPRPYIPHPVPYVRFETLALEAGFTQAQYIGRRDSPSGNIGMYAALALKGEPDV